LETLLEEEALQRQCSMTVMVFACNSRNFAATAQFSMTMGLQRLWIREEQLISSAWTSAKYLILSHTTSLSLKWGDMDLMGGPLGG